eukprot:SAG31_NODE_201_length_20535_cov_15.315081_22_plen_74_part_00
MRGLLTPWNDADVSLRYGSYELVLVSEFDYLSLFALSWCFLRVTRCTKGIRNKLRSMVPYSLCVHLHITTLNC